VNETPEFEFLLYSVADKVAHIILNRPDVLNAINDKMGIELQQAVAEAERDGGVRCLLITGNGRGFCAGEDLGSLKRSHEGNGKSDLGKALRVKYNPLILRLAKMEKPVVAAVNGPAAGAGFSLALACDIRFASEKAVFIQAFSKVGLSPDSGSSYFLPRSIGYARAAELMFTASSIDAYSAERLGIVNRVIKHEELQKSSEAFASQLAQGPGKSYSLIKRALSYGMSHSLEESLEYEAFLQTISSRTKDHAEGLAAFLEKRQPKFVSE
jgi:2-(1,2-epoxy-1,2-dihydrophenyl)acetyl-CoA isomerase